MPKKHPELPNVPLANDYVKTEEGRRLLKHGVYDTAIITRPYFLSPGTPKSRVQLLRRAFADALKDPDLLAEAKKGQSRYPLRLRRRDRRSCSWAVQNRAYVYYEDEAGSGSVATKCSIVNKRLRNGFSSRWLRKSSRKDYGPEKKSFLRRRV